MKLVPSESPENSSNAVSLSTKKLLAVGFPLRSTGTHDQCPRFSKKIGARLTWLIQSVATLYTVSKQIFQATMYHDVPTIILLTPFFLCPWQQKMASRSALNVPRVFDQHDQLQHDQHRKHRCVQSLLRKILLHARMQKVIDLFSSYW